MKLLAMIVSYQDGQNAQTLRQRLFWKIYINLIVALIFIEGRAGIVRGFVFDVFGV